MIVAQPIGMPFLVSLKGNVTIGFATFKYGEASGVGRIRGSSHSLSPQ